MTHNLPPGASRDPTAPYNEREKPDQIETHLCKLRCNNCGEVWDTLQPHEKRDVSIEHLEESECEPDDLEVVEEWTETEDPY